MCHIRRGSPIRKETWCWSEEVASAVKYKKACYKIWKKTGQIEDKKEYARAKMNSKRVVRKANSGKVKN